MIVLVGAGHSHIEILRQGKQLTSRGHEVMCISPDSVHPYSGMSPGVLGGIYQRNQVELPAEKLALENGIQYCRDMLIGLNAETHELRLASGRVQAYTILSFNIGSESILESSAAHVFRSKPVSELFQARAYIEHRCSLGQKCNVAVIGGGPAGVELAGNSACLLNSIGGRGQVSLYSSAYGTLAGLRGSGYRYLHTQLTQSGVQIIESVRVDPDELSEDIVLLATGIRPNRILEGLGLPLAEDSSLLVDAFLQVHGMPGIFAVGDCAGFHDRNGQLLDRVGVYAVRQQKILMHNLLASAEGRTLRKFRACNAYLAGVNTGCGVGYLHKNGLHLKGRPAFLVKDWIDRRFMRLFQ